MQANLFCPLHKPVAVCAYTRFRFGKWEHVRAHYRGLPSDKAQQSPECK
jgi:hypothetical protein